MTGDDLKRVQDNFLETAKKILLEDGRLRPIGFVVTLHKHVEKLFESGYGLEFIDPKECVRDVPDDQVTTLVVDLAMDWKKLYHAVLTVFPKTQSVLPRMLELGQSISVDDAYMRTTRAFLTGAQLDEKDVTVATMRQICDKAEAFACIMQSEAWLRAVGASETVEQIYEDAPGGLSQDMRSVEVIISSMETYDFARVLVVPIHREAARRGLPRDAGRVLSFEEPTEKIVCAGADEYGGRMVGLLKPLKEAS